MKTEKCTGLNKDLLVLDRRTGDHREDWINNQNPLIIPVSQRIIL